MELFTTIITTLLGSERTFTVEIIGDGVPRLTLSTGGTLCLEPDCVVLEDVEDDDLAEALGTALGAAGARLRRVWDFAARFPYEVTSGADRLVCTLDVPSSGETLGSDGLRGQLRLIAYSDGELSQIMESECVVVEAEALDGAWDDWTALLSAYDDRRAAWDVLSEIYPEDVCLELPRAPDEPVDEGWDDFLASLGLSPETAQEFVTPLVEAAFAVLPAVRARYKALYQLELPGGLAMLAALVEALGALPGNPPRCFWEPEPGRDRGCAWLDSALGMRPAGLSTWFAPGALLRQPCDAAEIYGEVPPGREGALDARLDMRYRRDAPQFVTFLGGDSDGLHWGFWYDSPAHFPVIAHNYARDSAETWLDGVVEVLPFMRKMIAKATEEAFEELVAGDPAGAGAGEPAGAEAADVTEDSGISYPLARWRALRVVMLLLDGIEAAAAAFLIDAPPEPPCPWPRTEGYPTGNPSLALRPDSGTVPSHVVSYQGTEDAPSLETRLAWIAKARRELAAGRPAYAQALGLYLHWADADDMREAAGALLLEAYEALGFKPFAGILRVHLQHRDLPSVGVFREE